MHISRLRVRNFRNFKKIDISTASNIVIVGENKVGKSNLLHALRLVLDPSLPDSARQLRAEDFWDGLQRPLKKTDEIEISLELSDFESSPEKLSLLAEHLITPAPMVARLTYKYRAKPTAPETPTAPRDFEFIVFGGTNEANAISHDVRRGLPIAYFHALRDAESDLETWRRSPLRPLLEGVEEELSPATLAKIARKVTRASRRVTELPEIAGLSENIEERIRSMVGPTHAISASLQVAPTDASRLLRALRLYFDEGHRPVSEASLGSANVLYLALTLLELRRLIKIGSRFHTYLAIEEPEAHLHPHVQRLVYRDALADQNADRTVILTTHSPHIASVTPIRSIVRLSSKKGKTRATTVANASFTKAVESDIKRYLDVTRGEILFARSILFVEGEAERFLLPTIAGIINKDHQLDMHGITVCSVSGTHFKSYVEIFGKGLKIPFTVITDGDPTTKGRAGIKRACRLSKTMGVPVTPEDETKAELELGSRGLFVGQTTIEWDLWNCGHQDAILESLLELSKPKTRLRVKDWKADPTTVTQKTLIASIERIGKGRFAQRLSQNLTLNNFPTYISNAIENAIKNARSI